MPRRLSNFLLILILMAGVLLVLYPSFSNWWNSMHQTHVIDDYEGEAAKIDNSMFELALQSAQEYNESLLHNKYRFQMTNEERNLYNEEMDVTGTSVMGIIEIPSINVELPIYHGTEQGTLQVAVGHLEGSSLPIGGPSTHCVLTGHRGMPSARLFTDLPKLEEGDIFNLTILKEVLTYQVDQIRTVSPHEIEELEIVEGEDYCTLITCTPYGINTHRMLVRGTRIETVQDPSSIRVKADAIRIDPLFVAIMLGVPMVLMFVLGITLSGPKKEKLIK